VKRRKKNKEILLKKNISDTIDNSNHHRQIEKYKRKPIRRNKR
jgi:hypothetical protein